MTCTTAEGGGRGSGTRCKARGDNDRGAYCLASGAKILIDPTHGLVSDFDTRTKGSDGLHVVWQDGGRRIDLNIFSRLNQKTTVFLQVFGCRLYKQYSKTAGRS